MRSFSLFFILFYTCFLATAQKYNQFDANGKRHGKWQKKYEDTDQLRYEGTFDHGKEVGEFKFYKPNNDKFPAAIKTFSKQNDTVRLKYFTQKGKVISEGKMVGRDRVGLWKYYHKGSNKIMMTENYEAGKLNGEQLTYFQNGQLTEKNNYINGKRNGKRFIYSETGVVMKEFLYENGVLHGPVKYFDPEGKLLIEGNYKRDRKDGLWKYYKDGKLSEQKIFPLNNG